MVIRVVFGIQTHVLTSIKPTIEVNQRGEEYTNQNELHVSFELVPNIKSILIVPLLMRTTMMS
jgi:hypothetical protein